jgi:hypothetical protein
MDVAVVPLAPEMITSHGVDELGGKADPVSHLPDAALDEVVTPSSRATRRTSTALSRYWNDEFRATMDRTRWVLHLAQT